MAFMGTSLEELAKFEVPQHVKRDLDFTVLLTNASTGGKTRINFNAKVDSEDYDRINELHRVFISCNIYGNTCNYDDCDYYVNGFD